MKFNQIIPVTISNEAFSREEQIKEIMQDYDVKNMSYNALVKQRGCPRMKIVAKEIGGINLSRNGNVRVSR